VGFALTERDLFSRPHSTNISLLTEQAPLSPPFYKYFAPVGGKDGLGMR